VARELELARAVAVPSEGHARAVERFLGREPGSLGAVVVPPGRDLALARREPLPPPAELGRLVLGAWGHLDPIKGADLVLEAVRAQDAPRSVEVRFAGGDVRPEFTARLRELAGGLDVAFHPSYDVDELDRHPVTAVHAMVSGTRAHESWGLVLDEAWRLGLPAIVPREGAFAERLAGGGGLLYESGDAASLAAALARLRAEPGLWSELRAGIPAPEDVCPSIEASLDRLVALYEDALRRGPPPPPADPSLVDLVRERALVEWDRSLSRRSPAELGFELPPEARSGGEPD
jgi:glycosyltransferase involved in cell wall biosynthesis